MGNSKSKPGQSMLTCLRTDNLPRLQIKLKKYNITPNQYILRGKTPLILAVLYDSTSCLEYLISLGHDVNLPEQTNKNTPFILAAKLNFINTLKILLEHNCNIHSTNINGFNALDEAILMGNYPICIHLLTHTELTLTRTLEEYKGYNETMNYPMFNIDLLYECLEKKVPLEEAPSFRNVNVRNRQKEFEGKVPDPNETWGQFIKRMGRFELYQPPLVDKEEVKESKRKGLYMRMQSKLCEMEYDIKSKIINII